MNESEKNERRSLIAELIKMAKADNEIRDMEFQFLLTLSAQMGIDKEEFKTLFEQYIEFNPPKLEFERIIQFQRLVLIMNIDAQANEEELEYIKDLGIRMGLHPTATNEVLRIMNDFPNRIVPPEKLIAIFKTFHN
jgi:uncharacterized tellurite resistance protein B-like protein